MDARFEYDDGGRAVAGFKGQTGDCVARAIAIVAELPYADVYARLAAETGAQRAGKRGKKPASARNGISTSRKWFKDYMAEIGLAWTPTMLVGQGCRVHLRADELPSGRLIVAVSKHYTAMVDGVIHDLVDCSRDGTRCVYGYWMKLDRKAGLDGSCGSSGKLDNAPLLQARY